MDREILKQIELLCHENGISLEKLTDELKRFEANQEYRNNIRNIEESKEIVGRCYKGKPISVGISFDSMINSEDLFFYKVVSERADRIDEVECLSFPQSPKISFRPERNKLWQPTNGIVGHYNYMGIRSISVNKKSIFKLTEISNDEFNTAAREHLEQLLLRTDWQDIAGPI